MKQAGKRSFELREEHRYRTTPAITRGIALCALVAAAFALGDDLVLVGSWSSITIYQPLATGAATAWALVVRIVLFYDTIAKRTGMLRTGSRKSRIAERSSICSPCSDRCFVPYGFWAMEANNLQSLLSIQQWLSDGGGMWSRRFTLLIGNLLRQLGQGHIFFEEDEKRRRR